jgi:hypothetical protein
LGEAVLPRQSSASRIALVCAKALVLTLVAGAAGCANRADVFTDQNDGGWFSKPLDVFAKPDWARPTGSSKTVELGPQGPVGPDDLVSPDGRCAPPPMPAEAAQASVPPPAATEPADRPVGSVAGDLAGAPMPAATQAAVSPPDGLQGRMPMPQVMGGIALGMTECQAVQRAGLPGNIAISAGEKGQRTVTLTYLSGTWPGIYHFADGRLNEVERAPTPPEPPKKPAKKIAKKKPVKKPNTAAVQ